MELISRKDAVNVFIRWNKKEFGYSDLNREMRFIDEIESLPTIEERKEGEWEKDKEARIAYRCTACGGMQFWSVIQTGRYHYCPNCGAKMKGE